MHCRLSRRLIAEHEEKRKLDIQEVYNSMSVLAQLDPEQLCLLMSRDLERDLVYFRGDFVRPPYNISNNEDKMSCVI